MNARHWLRCRIRWILPTIPLKVLTFTCGRPAVGVETIEGQIVPICAECRRESAR